YLVDNVFVLGVEGESDTRHPLRILSVEKTRLQTSHRGRHVFHLSKHGGCAISPSLHSVLRSLQGKRFLTSDPGSRAIIWSPNPGVARTLQFSGFPGTGPMSIRAKAQVLLYGTG